MTSAVVGRGEEVRQLEAFLDQMLDGFCGVAVDGDPGIGKTVLWEAGCRVATDRGYHVLTTRATEMNLDLGFTALADLLTPAVAAVEILPAQQRDALRQVLLVDATPSEPIDHRTVCVAFLRLVRELACGAPVLVAVDDVQWLDRASARAIAFTAHRLSAEPVGFLGTIRSSDTADVLGEAGLGLPRIGVRHLGPLDEASLAMILRSRLAVSLRKASVARLHRLSSGNPLWALQLAEQHQDSDFAASMGGAVVVPTPLAVLVQARLARLSPSGLSTVLMLSVSPTLTTDALESALGAEARRVGGISESIDLGVARLDGGHVALAHPLFGSVAYSAASAQLRRRIHTALAAVVADDDHRVRHLALAASRPDASLAARVETVAERASIRGAPDAAASLLRHAIRLTPARDTAGLVRRTVTAADRYLDAGETAEAVAILKPLRDRLPAGDHRAAVSHRLARATGATGRFRDAAELLKAAVNDVALDGDLRCAIERDLSMTMQQYGDLAGARDYARRAHGLAHRLDDADLISSTEVSLAAVELFLGYGCPPDVAERARAAMNRLTSMNARRHPTLLLDAMSWAAILKWSDRFADARAVLEQLYQHLAGRDEDGQVLPVLFQLGELECWTGNLRRADDLAVACHDAICAAGQPGYLGHALYLRGLTDCGRGSGEAAAAAATEALAISRRDDDVRMSIRALHVLGAVALADGEPGQARPYLDEALQLSDAAGYNDPGVFRVDGDAIEALIETGELDGAADRTARLEERGRRLRRATALATAGRCRGLLAAARAEVAEAESILRAVLSRYADLPQPVELGRTWLALGAVLRRQRQKSTARDALGAALDLFEASGAEQWANRAHRELARIGGRPAATGTLSETEHAVARLAGQGRTNYEIATELYLSPKTVEANLSRVYRKLAIRTRTELAAQLSMTGET